MSRQLLAFLFVVCCATTAAVTIYGEKAKVNCDSKGSCKVNLGSVGTVQLPALVAFKTAHSTYLSVTPPHGGAVTLSNHPKAWEEWDMIKVGDKVAFKSFHNTYLSQKWWPYDGYGMAAERLSDELFTIEDRGNGKIAIKGHNGHYLSAFSDKDLGVKQEESVDNWEEFTMEYNRDGKVIIRSAHGSFLGASTPQTYGNVTQADTLNTWETFVIDHVDKEKLTIETSHDTYIAAHAEHWYPRKLITVDRASLWELWTPYVNKTAGAVCFRAHDGTFMQAKEWTNEGWGLEDHCMEHEMLEVVLVNEKMLAAAAKAAAEARKAAEEAARAASQI